MGIYLNPGNIDFQQALNSKIYIDKSMLIEYANSVIYTEQKYICVSRPRRFGKSMAANMLTAYYSRGCDSREMFRDLKISEDESFDKHLNKYNVIHINMVNFLERSGSIDEMLDYLKKRLLHEIRKENGDVECFDWNDLVSVLDEVFQEKKIPFIFIIDEWDCVFRVHKSDEASQTKYLDFLRNLLKDQSYAALVYMTGILPIKKYGEHSARKTYTTERELPAGKGYADLVFLPRKNNSNPAMIVELKYDKSADGALEQIRKKQYTDCLKDYSGDILLVGINYDKDSKSHTCMIEKITK